MVKIGAEKVFQICPEHWHDSLPSTNTRTPLLLKLHPGSFFEYSILKQMYIFFFVPGRHQLVFIAKLYPLH